jgi:hypothetical protein
MERARRRISFETFRRLHTSCFLDVDLRGCAIAVTDLGQ